MILADPTWCMDERVESLSVENLIVRREVVSALRFLVSGLFPLFLCGFLGFLLCRTLAFEK